MSSDAAESVSNRPLQSTTAGQVDNDDVHEESRFVVDYAEKHALLKREKLRKNPLVPIGAGCTALVLACGLFSFKNGSYIWSQRMMRARVFAQAATIGVMAFSVYRVKSGD